MQQRLTTYQVYMQVKSFCYCKLIDQTNETTITFIMASAVPQLRLAFWPPIALSWYFVFYLLCFMCIQYV